VGSSKRRIYVGGLCNGEGVLHDVPAAGKLTPGDLNITMEECLLNIYRDIDRREAPTGLGAADIS
jgi:hypothetical protein